MSAWRAAIRALHALGGAASADDVCDVTEWEDPYVASDALHRCVQLGLAASDGRRGGNGEANLWRITDLGLDFIEHRVAQIESKPGGRRWAPTWLAVLPRCRGEVVV